MLKVVLVLSTYWFSSSSCHIIRFGFNNEPNINNTDILNDFFEQMINLCFYMV